jgi:glycosyltransferase involved in cell wall biosynthesis
VPEDLTVTVLLTVYNDKRIERVVESVLDGDRVPEELMIADGGSTDGTWDLAQSLKEKHDPVRAVEAPGNIPETRNQAVEAARGEVVAFIDADELAQPRWLAELVRPIEAGEADFTGGPTPALEGTTPTAAAEFYGAYMDRFYETVARENPHAMPMGNSAWRRQCFEEVGPLQVEGLHRQAPGEDHDFAVRCLQAGYEGQYVPESFLYHDYSHLDLPTLLEKQFHYALGGFKIYRRHGTTYESDAGSLLPYAVPPGLLAVGVLLYPIGLAPPFLGASLASLVLLLVLEWGKGLRMASEYPGMRHRWIEVLRRYVVIAAALRGLWEEIVDGTPQPEEA